MNWVDYVKQACLNYKDIALNLDAVINRGSLPLDEANAVALASAIATGNQKIVMLITNDIAHTSTEAAAASQAAMIMAQNNAWYPYVEMTGDAELKKLGPQLRMNVIGTHGGTTKERFEAYCLAASIVGKCHLCVKSHYDNLKKHGYSLEQLRDIGRIAAVINSLSRVIS